jgi:hypothetical protein
MNNIWNRFEFATADGVPRLGQLLQSSSVDVQIQARKSIDLLRLNFDSFSCF